MRHLNSADRQELSLRISQRRQNLGDIIILHKFAIQQGVLHFNYKGGHSILTYPISLLVPPQNSVFNRSNVGHRSYIKRLQG